MARAKAPPFGAVFRLDPMGWMNLRDKGYGFGYVGAVHKRRMDDVRPFRFANELICGRIARFLLLPCPPFGFTHFTEQDEVKLPKATLFSELDFDYERESRSLPDFDACIEALPELCAGILAFDILVANPDRYNKKHLWCDSSTKPRRLLIIDHDYALFGDANDGVQRLNDLYLLLGLGFTKEHTNHHPFLGRLPSARLLDPWYNKIASIPSWYITEVCREAEIYGISRTDSNKARDFLRHRSINLERLITSHKGELRSIYDWPSGGLFQ